MSFSLLPLAGWLAGLAGLAGLLFALQRLRVRHRALVVATTIFWQEAVQETRARVLVKRFRHPLAYLLVVLLAGLLWTVFASPQLATDDDVEHALLFDGSAGMSRGSRFADAKERLLELVRTLPRERTRVIYCGATARTLLAPGENELLLPLRLEGLAPEAAPESVTRLGLALATEERAEGKRLELRVLGIGPADDLRLPAGVTLVREPSLAVGASGLGAVNSGVTELGAAPASSGAYDRVDVHCVVVGDAGRDVAFSLDGVPLAREALRDLPARGGLLEATLSGPPDAVAADDRALLVLPNRRILRVALSTGAEAMASVLASDPGVLITGTRPDVNVRAEGEPAAPDLPELVITDSQLHSRVTVSAPTLADAAACARELEHLGLADAGATLRDAMARSAVTIGARAATGPRSARMERELTTPVYDLTSSRAYPLAIAHLLRWLVAEGARPTHAVLTHAGAGEPCGFFRGAMTGEDGRRLDPVGAAFVPPAAGIYRAEDGGLLAASLAAPATTLPAAVVTAAPGEDALPRRPLDLATLLLVAALALLATEWWLYRGGRIP